MTKTIITPYDVAEHLRTPEDAAAYLEACLEEANGDAAFIAKALGDLVWIPMFGYSGFWKMTSIAKKYS